MDIGKNTKAVLSITPASHSAGAKNGAGVDTKGFKEALIIINAGANGSSATQNVKVQESADNSTFADITGAAFTEITSANDNALYVGRIRLTMSRKRYLRVVDTVATAASILGAAIVLADAENAPAQTPAFDIHG